jgi:hypothetical protein
MKLISTYLRALRKYDVSLYLTDSGGAIKCSGIFPEMSIEWDGGIGYEGPALLVREANDLKDALELVSRVSCEDALPALKSGEMAEYTSTSPEHTDAFELPELKWSALINGCVTSDTLRANLTNPFVCYTKHGAYVVATDGYRLAATYDSPVFNAQVNDIELMTHIPLSIICADKASVICESCVSAEGGFVVLFSGCGATVRITWKATRDAPPPWQGVLPEPGELFDFNVIRTKPPKKASNRGNYVGLVYADDGAPLNTLVYQDDTRGPYAVCDPDGSIEPGNVPIAVNFQGPVLGDLHKLIAKHVKGDVYIDAPEDTDKPVTLYHETESASLLVVAVPLRKSAHEVDVLPAHLT